MPVVELVAKLLTMVIDAVGHEKARQLITEDEQRRANAAADAVAAAREAAGT